MSELIGGDATEPKVSSETFDALRYAMVNLFRYGVFAYQEMTELQDLGYKNHQVVARNPDDTHRPTFTFSGAMRDESLQGVSSTYSLWIRAENPRIEPFIVNHEEVEPATILRVAASSSPGERRPHIIQTIFTSTDRRVFEGMHFPNRQSASSTEELDEEEALDTLIGVNEVIPRIKLAMEPVYHALKYSKKPGQE